MSDLSKRMLEQSEWEGVGGAAQLLEDGAKEIERLTAENTKLEDEWAKLSKQLIQQSAENSDLCDQINQLKTGIFEIEAAVEQALYGRAATASTRPASKGVSDP